VVVVVVLSCCAKAVLSAIAQAVPAANIFINLVCFIFVLCLVKRMISAVDSSDSFQPAFIQPHLSFVIPILSGCMAGPKSSLKRRFF
jgi:hypothetical protein